MRDSSRYNSDIKNPAIKKSVFLLLDKSSTKILLVEGKGDKSFYCKYVNSSIIVSEVTKTKNYIDENNGKQDSDYQEDNLTAKKFLQFIIDKHQKHVKSDHFTKYGFCYGIVDKDYDGIDTNTYPDMGNFITCTDQRDLETTLIYFDRHNIELCFENDFKQNDGTYNVLEKSIEAASQIGKARFLREAIKKRPNNFKTKTVTINFKDNEFSEINGKDGYYKFLSADDFVLDAFLSFKNTQNVKDIEDDIKTLNDDPLSYCRGHDIFDFVASFYKLVNPTLSWKGLSKITALIDKYETQLKEVFDDTEFKAKSQLYHFLQENQLT